MVSLDRYWTALIFHNGVGTAKKHGTTITLGLVPDLGSGPVHQLVYIPENGQHEVSTHPREPMRLMSLEEIHAADALLERLTRETPRESCHYSEPWKDGRC